MRAGADRDDVSNMLPMSDAVKRAAVLQLLCAAIASFVSC